MKFQLCRQCLVRAVNSITICKFDEGPLQADRFCPRRSLPWANSCNWYTHIGTATGLIKKPAAHTKNDAKLNDLVQLVYC